jgi:glycine/D-amino acid oxidase-like deaminating enzyme/nitrite reductase/ring-hydroxylating ferredoxin subunit
VIVKDHPNRSVWVATTDARSFPAVTGEVDVDVAIAGAGIVGVTTALLLKRAGLRVALLDMDRIGHGVTGYTTAKVSSTQGLKYQQIESSHSEETARSYAMANQRGLELILSIIDEEGIDCDLERKANYVYTERSDERKSIEKEVESSRRAGLATELVTDTSLPYSVVAALRHPDQAQFHPLKYLAALVDLIDGDGSFVFENSRVTDVKEGTRCSFDTDGGSRVISDYAVIATNYPFTDRSLMFARVHPSRSYAIAGPAPADVMPDGMFISGEQPTRSVRTIPEKGRTLLMVGGEGHKVGRDYDTRERYANLRKWANERFGMTEFPYEWSSQDGTTIDQLPYAGTYRRSSERVFTATGFSKWGFTNGAVAAEIMSDAILARPNAFAATYDPHRVTLSASAKKAVKENSEVAMHWTRDRIAHPQRGDIDSLAPGGAAVMGGPLEPVGVHRDDEGNIHCVSAVCTHLACTVTWNTAERSWDCPCHGSRFDFEGRVLQGPAVKDLPKREPPT